MTTMYGGTSAARLVAAGGTLLAICLLALLGSGQVVQAYPGVSDSALAATAVAAACLLGGACVAVGRRATQVPGVLGVLVAVAWLSPVALGWVGGPDWLRATAMLAGPLLVPLLVHLIVHQGSPGSADRGRTRAFVGASYLLALGMSIAIAVTRDPLLDLDCWRDCSVRALAVAADAEVANALGRAWSYVVIGTAVLACLYAAARTVLARAGLRATTAAVCLPAAAALLACAWSSALQLAAATDHPGTPGIRAAYLGQAGALATLGAGLGWLVWRGARQRSALRSVAARLGTAPDAGGLREQLAVVLDDPSVEVAYWLPEHQRYVDAAGAAVSPRDGAGRVEVEVRRHGAPLALVTLAGPRADGDQIVEGIGATAQLAVDNERLRAAVLAELSELNASRRRIVTASDEARRRFERDLHDGAQAELVSLIFGIAGARANAERAGDMEQAMLLADLNAEVSAIAGRLREFTHGVFPPVLEEAGLDAALWSLRDEAPAPVLLDISLDARPSAAVERAAYLIASHMIGRAPTDELLKLDVHGGADRVCLLASRCDDLPVELRDRVGALGGEVVTRDGATEVTLPCASS